MTEAASTEPSINLASGIAVGKYWAAVRDDKAIGLISMRVPSDVDFDSYRERANSCLQLLGDVKSGELVVRGGAYVFIQRKTHANRSKKPEARQAKEYSVQF